MNDLFKKITDHANDLAEKEHRQKMACEERRARIVDLFGDLIDAVAKMKAAGMVTPLGKTIEAVNELELNPYHGWLYGGLTIKLVPESKFGRWESVRIDINDERLSVFPDIKGLKGYSSGSCDQAVVPVDNAKEVTEAVLKWILEKQFRLPGNQ